MDAKDKIDWLKSNYPNLELYPIEADELIEMLDNYHKQEFEEGLPDNPYPESVFIPATEKELKAVVKLLKDNGYSPDNLFGNWGRTVWDNCIEAVKQSTDD